MKKSLILTSLLAIMTSSNATDVNYLLGLGWEKGNLNGSYTVNAAGTTISENNKDDASDLKLKAGVILNNSHRVYASYIDYDMEGGGSFDIILLNYEYLIQLPYLQLPYKNATLALGAHIGNSKYDNNDTVDMSGLTYGLQAGVIFEVTKNIELETGFTYSKYNVDESISGTVSGVPYTGKIELVDSKAYSVGINFKF